MYSLMMWNVLCSVPQWCKLGCEEKGQSEILLNRLWADWQKHLHLYLSGSVMVTIESQWFSNETHCEQGPGDNFNPMHVKTFFPISHWWPSKTTNFLLDSAKIFSEKKLLDFLFKFFRLVELPSIQIVMADFVLNFWVNDLSRFLHVLQESDKNFLYFFNWLILVGFDLGRLFFQAYNSCRQIKKIKFIAFRCNYRVNIFWTCNTAAPLTCFTFQCFQTSLFSRKVIVKFGLMALWTLTGHWVILFLSQAIHNYCFSPSNLQPVMCSLYCGFLLKPDGCVSSAKTASTWNAYVFTKFFGLLCMRVWFFNFFFAIWRIFRNSYWFFRSFMWRLKVSQINHILIGAILLLSAIWPYSLSIESSCLLFSTRHCESIKTYFSHSTKHASEKVPKFFNLD